MRVGFSAGGTCKKPVGGKKSQGNIFGSAEVTSVRLEVPKGKISVPAGPWDLAESSVPEGWELYQPFCLVLEQSLLSSLHMLSLTHVNLKKGMTSAAPQLRDSGLPRGAFKRSR